MAAISPPSSSKFRSPKGAPEACHGLVVAIAVVVGAPDPLAAGQMKAFEEVMAVFA